MTNSCSSYLAVFIVCRAQLLPQLIHSVFGASGGGQQLPPVYMHACSVFGCCPHGMLNCCCKLIGGLGFILHSAMLVDSQSCRVHAAQYPAGRLQKVLGNVVQHARLQRPHPQHVADAQLPEVAGRPRPV